MSNASITYQSNKSRKEYRRHQRLVYCENVLAII